MVSQADLRLREAGKLGFRRALRPKRRSAEGKAGGAGVQILEIGHLQDLIDWLYGEVRSLSAGKKAQAG